MKTIELCKLAQKQIQNAHSERNFSNFEINQTENDGVNAYLTFESAEHSFFFFPAAYGNVVTLEYQGYYDDTAQELYYEEFENADDQLAFVKEAIDCL